MREIPLLQVLCLRSVGAHVCNAEKTFQASKESNEPSTASRLLRSFHNRPVKIGRDDAQQGESASDNNAPSLPPMTRQPCVGPGASRRSHANDVDLNHPFIAAHQEGQLVMEYGNPALDCLQSYIDSLVELGRMDDTRLGVCYFREWKHNVSSNKRKRSDPLGSLSLHNCCLSEHTIHSMVKSGMGERLGVLDLGGVQGLTDDLLQKLLQQCPNLLRLSLKNGRRLTAPCLDSLSQHNTQLTCLDIGGCYNMTPQQVLDRLVPHLPHLIELHASGLAWTDATLQELLEERSTWEGLSLGFSRVSGPGLRHASWPEGLQSLALHFCENAVDNAVVGFLGRSLPRLECLDVRGNSNLSSLTGFFDGRQLLLAGGDDSVATAERLFVLGRYSNLTKGSVEETKRIHPVLASDLTVVLDGGGDGEGIRR